MAQELLKSDSIIADWSRTAETYCFDCPKDLVAVLNLQLVQVRVMSNFDWETIKIKMPRAGKATKGTKYRESPLSTVLGLVWFSNSTK